MSLHILHWSRDLLHRNNQNERQIKKHLLYSIQPLPPHSSLWSPGPCTQIKRPTKNKLIQVELLPFRLHPRDQLMRTITISTDKKYNLKNQLQLRVATLAAITLSRVTYHLALLYCPHSTFMNSNQIEIITQYLIPPPFRHIIRAIIQSILIQAIHQTMCIKHQTMSMTPTTRMLTSITHMR